MRCSTKCLRDAAARLGGMRASVLTGVGPRPCSQVIRWREMTQALLVLAKYFEYVLSGDNQLYLNWLTVCQRVTNIMNISFCLVKGWDKEHLRNSGSGRRGSRQLTGSFSCLPLPSRPSFSPHPVPSPKAPGHPCRRFWFWVAPLPLPPPAPNPSAPLVP